jgi:hypothetical protein
MNPRQPSAEAIAVRDDKILAVGSRAEVAQVAGEAARIVDLGAKTVVPGFMVMNPGDYEMGDYARPGLPLVIIIFVVSLILVPLIWPL